MPRILNKDNIIATVDIGTSKTCCLLAYYQGGERTVVVGAGVYQNNGVRDSEITDMGATVDSVKNAVELAEKNIGERIKTVVASSCAKTLESQTVLDSIDLGGAEVTQNIVNRLIASAQGKIPASKDKILHCAPIDYTLDSRYAVADPRGLTGESLHVSLLTVFAPSHPVNDTVSALEHSNLSCSKIVASPYAAGLACLTEDEKKQGTAVIDLGAGTTGIAFFYGDQPVFITNLPFGGDQITRIIARTFHASLPSAEKLKTLYGSTLSSATYATEDVVVPLLGENDATVPVNRADLVKIIAPEIQKLFENVKAVLTHAGLCAECQNFVLTGGGALLHGINEKAAEILERPVRSGSPRGLNDDKKIVPPAAYQSYMNCIGMMHYTTRVLMNTPQHKRDVSVPGNKFVRLLRWFLDNS